MTNEGTSLLENCVGLGLPIPQTLQDTLIQLKEGNKKEL
ncbi:putative holin (fragment) [Clostridium neonatale]